MAFDGIVCKKIVNELNSSITGGKINKIYEPNKNEILLGIYNNGKNYALNICIDSNNCRLSLTTTSKPNPQNAMNFCMLLRKHLIGFKIKNISMIGLERIVIIDLEGYDELNDLVSKKLVIELMGRHSNIILVNNKNFIIDSMRHLDILSNSTRDIMPAREYIFPKSNKHLLEDFDNFYSIVSCYTDVTLEKAISSNFIGISMISVWYILQKLGISSDDFSINSIHKIFDYLIRLLDNNSSTSIALFTNEKNKSDFCVDFDDDYTFLDTNFKIDDFYYAKESNETFSIYRNNILKLILLTLKKYKSRISSISKKLEECNNRDLYKLYGELIITNLYRINNENLSTITLENYYDNNNLVTIPLDKSISIQNNAKKFFKKYSKLKNALEIVSMQKEETLSDILYLESIIYEVENCTSVQDLNEIYSEISENKIFADNFSGKNSKKNKKENISSISNALEYDIEGFKVLVGKNNKQNDYLTTKIARNSDIWFHTKDIHGSHVILKMDSSKEITDSILSKCASLAAFYSKAKLSSNVPVDYCFVKYVKKPSKSNPGMVIYTHNKTLYVDPKNF